MCWKSLAYLRKIMSINFKNLLFYSGSNTDKIIGVYTGSFSVGASSFPASLANIGTYTTPHGVTYGVLPVMIWSTNNSDWYEAGATDFTAGGTLDTRFEATAYTTSTDLVIVAANWTGGALTCYWKAVLIDE
jgi:hypothetical protein